MRQREMAHIPTPAYTLGVQAGTVSESLHVVFDRCEKDGRIHYRPYGTWPDCDRCKQSCQAVYVGKPTCRRCTSARRLNA